MTLDMSCVATNLKVIKAYKIHKTNINNYGRITGRRCQPWRRRRRLPASQRPGLT